MGGKVGTDSAFDDLNLTPLIDVVLVVLIIMMVSIPIQVQEMGVKVPDPTPDRPPPKPPAETPDQLVIAIYEDGKIALNRKLMEESKLSFELNRRIRGMSKKNVFIDADLKTPYSRVVEMIDLARSEGAEKVGLAKVKENGPQAWTSVDSGAMPRGVFIGSPLVNGMITEKKADEAIQLRKSEIMSCYGAELAINPKVTGRMMLTVLITPEGQLYVDESGAVENPKISGNDLEGASEAIETCVLEVLKKVTTQPLGEGNTAAITYPVIFSPG